MQVIQISKLSLPGELKAKSLSKKKENGMIHKNKHSIKIGVQWTCYGSVRPYKDTNKVKVKFHKMTSEKDVL